jgi:hypothetical protein
MLLIPLTVIEAKILYLDYVFVTCPILKSLKILGFQPDYFKCHPSKKGRNILVKNLMIDSTKEDMDFGVLTNILLAQICSKYSTYMWKTRPWKSRNEMRPLSTCHILLSTIYLHYSWSTSPAGNSHVPIATFLRQITTTATDCLYYFVGDELDVKRCTGQDYYSVYTESSQHNIEILNLDITCKKIDSVLIKFDEIHRPKCCIFN